MCCQGAGNKDVTFVMSRSSAGHILVALWDGEGGHASAGIAQNMAAFIQKGTVS